LYQREESIEILRLPPVHKDMLRRAGAFASFVQREVAARTDTLERIVFRDPWGGVPALRAAPGVRSLFEVNALPSWELAYTRPGFAHSPALQAKVAGMERFCLRHASSVLCVSAVTRSALIDEGVDASKIDVIPNAAGEAFYSARGGADPLLCGYVGGLHPWQGVEFFIDAFAAAAVEGARLLIVHGGGQSAREVQRRIARHKLDACVSWREALTPVELAAALRTMRFSVAPLAETERNTRQGCCPVKIVESLAAGVPVLASDLAVTRELIVHEVNGWLAPPGDVRAWAHAIRRAFGGARPEPNASGFAWPIIHSRLSEVFR